MGNQGHSYESMRVLKEWLDDGAIGKVTEVHAWTDRPVGGDPWSDFAQMARPTDTPPVPETLDWDLWLGPVPYRPYHPEYHPTKWRAWLDFGTGALGDMGCHILDPAFWALELGAPRTVQATSTHFEPEVASRDLPARVDRPLRVPGPRQAAAGEAHLVRRAPPAAHPRRSSSRDARCRRAGRCSSETRGRSCTARTAPTASA